MRFSWALAELQLGFKVTRKHWKNNQFLWRKPAVRVEAAWCHDPVLKKLAEQQDGVPATPTISVADKDVDGTWIITTGWIPQQYDLFAEDWTTWQTEEQDSIDKLPKAGGMANCDKLSNSINQLLDTVTNTPSLNAYVELGPNDKELTITIREEGPTADSVPIHVGCTFHITKTSIGGYGLNDSSIGSPVKSTKAVAGGYEVEDMQSSLNKEV